MRQMRTNDSWKEAKNILCIRLDSLGDVLMTTPAIRALKEFNPARKITLLTSNAGARVAALIPEISQTVIYNAPWMKATKLRSDSSQEHKMAAQLRHAGFDAAVIFTVFSQNPLPAALLAYLADIPLRLAYCRENPYQLLTDWAFEADPGPGQQVRHEVRRHLDLVAKVGCHTQDESLSICVPASAERSIRKIVYKCGLDLNAPWVVIHPGASAPSRRYRPDGFARAAYDLIVNHGIQVVFTGSLSERSLVQEIQSQIDAPSISEAGYLKVDQLAALLALAPLLISNNTGPVHIAAAVGTPVIDIYALTNPQHTPWGIPYRLLYHDVPCKFCYKSICPMVHHNCLRLVTPESVVQAALELLEETRLLRTGIQVT